jgi:rRNA maturation endonuclease Nob1
MLTPVALAHLIMGDGTTWSGSGVILCTDSYSIQDVVRLINVLIYRYYLKCNIRICREGQYRIYISKKSMELLRTIVMAHMTPSMFYKVISINN